MNGTWSELRPVANDSTAATRVARSPYVVASDDGAFVLGNNIHSVDAPAPTADLLTAWRLDGPAIGRPSGDHTFAFPVGAVNASGELHVLWAEPVRSTPDSVSFLAARFTSLWTASFTQSAGWSQPEMIYEGSFKWNRIRTDDVISLNGEPALALPLFGIMNSGVLFVTRQSNQWSAKKAASLNASYTSLAAWRSMLFLAVIGVDPSAKITDRNSVFLLQSSDGGTSWGTPTRISPLSANAFDVKLRIGVDGTLHLLWLQPVGAEEQVLRHTWATASSLSWSAADDLSVPPSFTNLQAALDPCGRLHVAYLELSGVAQDGRVRYAVWDHGWSPSVDLFPALRTTDAALRMLSDDRLALVLLAQSIAARLSSPIQNLFSELTIVRR